MITALKRFRDTRIHPQPMVEATTPTMSQKAKQRRDNLCQRSDGLRHRNAILSLATFFSEVRPYLETWDGVEPFLSHVQAQKGIAPYPCTRCTPEKPKT